MKAINQEINNLPYVLKYPTEKKLEALQEDNQTEITSDIFEIIAEIIPLFFGTTGTLRKWRFYHVKRIVTLIRLGLKLVLKIVG